MTSLQLYKFIQDNKLEWHYEDWDVILFVDNMHIQEWSDLLGYTILADSIVKPIMKAGYFAFYMQSILEYFDIDMYDVFDIRKKEA